MQIFFAKMQRFVFCFIFAFHSNNGVDKARANLKEKYQNYFDALGIELDFDKIGNIVKK